MKKVFSPSNYPVAVPENRYGRIRADPCAFRPAANVRRKRLTTQYSRRQNTGVSLRESEYLHSSRSLPPTLWAVALVPPLSKNSNQ